MGRVRGLVPRPRAFPTPPAKLPASELHMTITRQYPDWRRAVRCALLMGLTITSTNALFAQSITPLQARAQLTETERDLAATQSEIDFWEKVTLDRDLFVVPVQTNVGTIVIPARRADVVAYLAREIATDLLTGNRHNFAPSTERLFELQQLSNANKDAIRSDLLAGLYSSRYTLLEQRNALEAALAAGPVPWPGQAPVTQPGTPSPTMQGMGQGWVFDRVIVDPNRLGRRGEQMLNHEANASGGSVTMRWSPRANCSEDWVMSWHFDDPVDFVRAGMHIPVRMHIELAGPGCNYPQGSYLELGQQNWEPYLQAELAVDRIAGGTFEWTGNRVVADSAMPVPANDGTAELVVRQQPPDVGQSWAIFRIFSYVPGFNFTTIYVFRGN